MSVRYRDAGVDLEAAEEVSARITERVRARGLFGGFLPVSSLKAYDEPVLVSSIDGIGTKVRLAAKLGRVAGLGRDIVHHCVNDIAVHGAEPLLFMDYLAFNRLDGEIVERIVGAISDACAALNIELAGGETAEMPLVYPEGHFDIAGAIVGVVENANIVDGSSIVPGDILLGLPASGLHTNGYSLVQHLFADEEYGRYERDLGSTLGDALIEPHRCYLTEIRALLRTGAVHGLAHITGGGIAGNLARIIPAGLQAEVELPRASPPLFAYLAMHGVSMDEMCRVFNMGIGLIAVCDPSILTGPPAEGTARDDRFPVIGTVETSTEVDRRVIFHDHR